MTLFKDIVKALQGRWTELRDTRKNYRTTEAGQSALYVALVVFVVIAILLLLGVI